MVNPLPTTVTVTPASQGVCAGSIQQLVVSGGELSGLTILSENFNGATNSWTTINNSTGGTDPLLAEWTLQPDAYVYSTYGTWHSNDNSQFYLSNSDAPGSGVTVSTILQSPSFSTSGFTSASLSFYHYYNFNSQSAKVDYSTDGTTWTNLKTYTADAGSVGAFVQDNVVLPAGALNQASVYIRFKYDAGWDYFWGIDNVSITGTASAPFTWTPTTDLYTDAAATIAFTGGNATTLYSKPLSDVTYTVTATSGSSCTTTGISALTVNPLPTVTLTSSPTVTICNGENSGIVVALTGTAPWVLTATDGTSTGPINATSSPRTITVAPTVNTIYSILSVADANGCTNTSTASVDVTVNTPVAVTITESAGVLTSSATTGNQWYNASGLIPGETAQTFTPSANGNYYVIVTDGNSCTTTSNTISFVLSMDNNLFNAGISVYPNPAYDKVFVEISNPSNSKFTVEILSMDGRTLYENKSITKANSTLSIDLSDFASGVYFVKAISESNTVIQKIVVE